MKHMTLRVVIAILFYTAQASAQCTATVTCSGQCSCGTGSGTSSGTIDTGYSNNWGCYWTITSIGSISLQIYRFSLENGYDFGTITSNVQLCRSSSGNGCFGTYTSTTGTLSLSLTADSSVLGSGIGASWSVACAQNCAAGYTGAASCTACAAGKYKTATGSAACTDCPFGSSSPTTSVALTACICYAGFSGPDGGPCTTCVAGKYKTTSGSTCTDCAAGTYRTAANAASCTTTIQRSCGVSATDTCSASMSSILGGGFEPGLGIDQNMGTIFHTDGNTGAWWLLDFGRSVMVTKFIMYNRQDCCYDRIANYKITVGDSSSVNINAVCVSNMPAPLVSPYMADAMCTTTLRGRYLHFSIGGGNLHFAELQVTGCWDGGVCETCPAGTTSPIASTSSAACISPACNAGYTGPSGGPCTACVAGKYKIATGSAVCTDCGAGTYSTTVGATVATTCLTCPTSSNSPIASLTLIACTCNVGFTGPNGGPCTACVAGKYKTTTGNAVCTDCAADKYSATAGATLESTCLACPANSNSPSPSTVVTSCTCNVGFMDISSGTCTACATGSYGNGWTLVRRVPAGNAWHPATDGLVGTVVYGTYSSNPQDNNIGTGWSINFETAVPGYNEFRFASGDGQVWLITTKAAIGGAVVSPAAYYSNDLRTIMSSSVSSTPYSARWYYRSGIAEDPWISVVDHGDGTGTDKILYGQNSYLNHPSKEILITRKGANVFIRKAACTNCPTGTYSTTTAVTAIATCVACPANSNSPSASTAVAACTCNAGSTGPDGGLTLTTDSTNLVAWYKLNGDLTDSTGRTGSLINAGGTLAFAQDATLNSNLPYFWYAVGSGTSNLNYARTPVINRNVPLSFAFWFKTTGSAAYTILSYGDKSVENPSIQFDFNSGQLNVATALSTPWTFFAQASGLVVNTWYFVVYTLSNANPVSTILYVDGTQRATGTGTTGQTLPRFKDLTVANSGDTGRGFAGHIGDIRIYDKVLIQTEITSLFTNMPTPCTTCVAGKYKSATGSAVCADCAANTFSSATGATSSAVCASCAAGFSLAVSGTGLCTTTSSTLERSCGSSGTDVCTASQSSTDPYLLNGGVECWNSCGSTEGPCSFCGGGSCCRQGWSSSWCNGIIGGAGQHQCAAGAGMIASKALDGNLDSASITSNGGVQWWRLDFGRSVSVAQVIVYNRKDCCWSRLTGFKIAVGDSPSVDVNAVCASNQPAPLVSPFMAQVTCPTPLVGQYLHISISSGEFLQIGEVQVTGCPACQVVCAAGTYRVVSACVNCAAGKYSPATGATLESTCVSCPGNSNSPSPSTVVTACTCNAGSTGPDGDVCSLCVAGKYKIGTGIAACTDCAAGKYSATAGATLESTCVTCPGNSNSPSPSSAVTACSCNAGSTGPDGGVCTACVAGKYKLATGNAVCTDCAAGKYSPTAGATLESTCVACPANSNSPSQSTAVTACTCNAGSTGPDGSVCTTCVAGKYKLATGNAVCTDCAAGKYSPTAGATFSTICAACPANSGASCTGCSAAAGCTCNAGSTGPDGSACSPCAAGKYKISTGNAACTDCAAAKYLGTQGATVESACLSCPGNSNSPGPSTASTACTCNVGFTGPDGGTCTSCAAGKYKITTGNAVCTDCSAGKYSATAGATLESTCLVCPGNSNSPSPSSAATACSCNAGSTGPDGGVCSPCAAGKYKIGTGIAPCTDCEPGKFSATTGATALITCIGCMAGTNSPAASTSSDACTFPPCNAGYTGPDGMCSACAAGKYKSASGSAVCTDCATGTYSSNLAAAVATTCLTCPAGMNSPAASTSSAACIFPPCNAGYTGPDGICSTCAAGTYKVGTGPAPCMPCVAGKYSTLPAATAETACLACAVNSNSLIQSSTAGACTCNAGYSGPNGGTCAPCAAGQYKSSTGSAACTSCPAFSGAACAAC